MVDFTVQGVLAEGPASYFTGITDLDIHMRDGAPVLYASSGPSGGITSFTLGAGGPVLLDQDAFQPGQIQASSTRTEEVTVGGQTVMVTLGHHDTTPQCFDLGADGQLVSSGQLVAEGGFSAAIVSMETMTVGARDFVYVSHFGVDGITVYEANASGQLVQLGQIPSASGQPAQGADLVALECLEIGGQSFLLSLSALDNSLTTYRLNADGIPVQIDKMSSNTGLSIAAPTDLVTAVVDGVQYVIVAAAGSGSLSVLELQSNGVLVPTDHVLDDLDTRFQAVTALETITVDGQTYLVAGGGDDGLSLFTLLPGGRLLHLAQIADSADTALSNISALALHVENGVLQIFASGEAEAGITHLSVDLSQVGQTLEAGNSGGQTTGTAGDDILIDGAGSDTLQGGAGADVFVFGADGQIDRVEDFELGVDRLDLSGLGRIYSLQQLTILETSWGARVIFGDEEIQLYSANGLPLDPATFQIGDLVDLTHFQLIRQAVNGYLEGDGYANELIGGSENNVIKGMQGDDLLDGGVGNDELEGATGDDTLRGGDGSDTLLGGGDDDHLDGGTGNDELDGGSGADRLLGNIGNDTLRGGGQNDGIFGDDGNDLLFGDGGRDSLRGGVGEDTLSGGWFNDWLYGESGNDLINGDGGHDRLFGGAGEDTLYGGNGGDTLFGADQNDLMDGGTGNDSLFGEGGTDTLRGGIGTDTLSGGQSSDWLYGDAGNDILNGDTGNDYLFGGSDNDAIFGGSGEDNLFGDGGRDSLRGGTGNDTLSGGWFNDWIYGEADDDLLNGDGGHDRLFGGSGADTLRGGTGGDTLFGADQNDLLFGDDGNDSLFGENGNDTLRAGRGNDTLSGGSGSDQFIFSNDFGLDVITDFDPNDDAERIDLSAVSAISDLNDLVNNHMDQVGNNVVVRAGIFRLTVEDVTIADLSDGNDFLF